MQSFTLDSLIDSVYVYLFFLRKLRNCQILFYFLFLSHVQMYKTLYLQNKPYHENKYYFFFNTKFGGCIILYTFDATKSETT